MGMSCSHEYDSLIFNCMKINAIQLQTTTAARSVYNLYSVITSAFPRLKKTLHMSMNFPKTSTLFLGKSYIFFISYFRDT